jgi:hypothetical protein
VSCNGNLSEADKMIDNLLQNKLVAILVSVISVIIESFVVKSLYDKYQNHSNIKSFKENVIIPEDLNPL